MGNMEEQLIEQQHPIQNPNIYDSSKTREEGELSDSSSDDDDDQNFCSSNQFTSTNAASLEQQVHIGTVNDNSEDTLAEKCTSSKIGCSDDVPSITPRESGHLKISKKNRKHFVPFLISFSDDSGSDCENSGQKKISASKNRTLAADKSKKPPAPVPQRPKKSQKITRGEENMVPRERPVSHSVVPSLTKINGGTYGNVHSVRNFNNLDKVVTLDHRKGTNVHLNSSKLQDLRHQLNLQKSQITKNLTSASCRDSNLVNKRNFVVKASTETTHDNLQEIREPVKKRPKMVSPTPTWALSNSQEITSMVIRSERRALDDSNKLERDDHSSQGGKYPSCSTVAGRLKQTDYQDPASSTNPSLTLKEGIDALRNQNQSCVNSSKEVASKAANKLDKKKHDSEFSSQCRRSILQEKVSSVPAAVNLTAKSNSNLVGSNESTQKPAQNGGSIAASTHGVARNAGANITSLNFPSFQNCCDKLNISGSSSIDLKSLLHFEELQEKELEEAQEYRRKCEIEERNALKSYRKAQRALFEANARCSDLYNKREQYSAQLRYLMMENPHLLWSSKSPEEGGIGLDPLPSTSDVNGHLIPTSNFAMQPTFDFNNQHRCNLNIHPNSVARQTVSSVQKHCDLAADPSNEPDGIRFDPNKEDNDASGMCPPYEDINMSQNEGEDTFQLEHESPENSPDYQGKAKSGVDMENNTNSTSEGQSAMDSSQDSLLLEASLRSQLVERLKMRTLSRKTSPQESLETVAEARSENDELEGRVVMCMDNGLYSDSDREKEPQQGSDLRGCDEMSMMSKMPVEVNHQCNNEKLGSTFAPPSSNNPLDSCTTIGDDKSQFASSITFSYPILKSTLLHFKVSDSKDILKLQIKNSSVQTSHDHGDDNFGSGTIPPSISSLGSVESALVDSIGSNSGSYSCNFAIDPLWPLCMFELRGKCNNDECSWQHFRDYSSRSRMKATLDNEDKVGSPNQGQLFSATRMLTKSLDCLGLAPPAYLVGLDVLRADLQSCKSILSHEYGQPWMKCFSLFFVLSSQLPTDLSSDEPLCHGISAGAVQGGWNRLSFYFQSRSGLSGPCHELSADDDQIVEMALLALSQEANKLKGRLQALKLLAQALEANPTSAFLWIIYLLIYYSRQKSIRKEDMYQCAVEQSEGSYELWLLYINSRTQLDERLAAYDAALLSLCRHASASDINALSASDCILDIFLQMMNCLCMSGNVAKAIEKINELYPTEKKSDNPLKLSLPDIIICLNISDKCIFWVCCVYLVVYRKLPDAIVRRFEYQKELSSIDWPSADLTFDEKRRGVSLMELAVDSLVLYIDRESLEVEANLRAAQLFSINHVRCIVVLKGLESSRSLLERYVKLYPSCLELVLMLARAEHDFADGSFEGFEDALDNWFDEDPGAQCIWNQYVQCALQDRKIDFVKELMARWFQSLWNCRYSQNSCLDTVDSGNSQALPQSASVSDIAAIFSNSSQKDVVFGLLNCSIYKLLQNDYTEALLAINRAFGAASAENYIHCVREHLLFPTAENLHDNRQLLKLLCGYLADNRASATSEPLSRQFIQRIKKPRVRQLVGKLLCPVSLEPSMVNAVLEAWYGPSLLPEKTDKLTNSVDMVESLMEILPSNYHLAISVCKQLTRSSDAATVSGAVSFWASSLLISALFQAVPVAPEYAWVEAADILNDLTGFRSRSLNFLKRALSIYPFSIMLWKSYLKLSEAEGNSESVKEAARQKGIKL